jgi:hypothetical protein
MKYDQGTELGGKEQTKYRIRVGKLLHMIRWSRPEIYNVIRYLSRLITIGSLRCAYEGDETSNGLLCVKKGLGLVLNPYVKWKFKLAIRGISDSNFEKDPETQKSVSGNSTFLC